MRGFDKRTNLSLFADCKLVVLCGSTVDELFVALCCTSVAAPVPEICSLEVRKYALCNYGKTTHIPSVIIFVNMVLLLEVELVSYTIVAHFAKLCSKYCTMTT